MSDLTTTEPRVDFPPPPEGVKERIDAMGPQQIELRRTEIVNEVMTQHAGDWEKLSTAQLHELAYIASKLRRTNVGPPKEAKQKAVKAKSIDDLI